MHWEAANRIRSDRKLFLAAVIIGLLAGLLAYGMNEIIHRLTDLLGTNKAFGFKALIGGSSLALLSGYLTFYFFPQTGGSGIPQFKLWLVTKPEVISLKDSLSKLLTCILSLTSGFSLGREGPIVFISGGIGASLGKIFNFSQFQTKKVALMGAVAGISAAFNTPMAAVVFVLEELVGDLNARSLGPLILAAVTASYTVSVFLGFDSSFPVIHYQEIIQVKELVVCVAIGILAGISGPAWNHFVIYLRKTQRKVFKNHQKTYLMACYCLVILSSFFLPEVLGGGHHFIQNLLMGEISWGGRLFILFIAKFMMSAVSYSSGVCGGIFMPTLFIGAVMGGGLGSLYNHMLGFEHEVAAYSLIGMGAFFISVIRAPLTSIIIIFELTHDYRLIAPLMLANAVSYLISSHLSEKNIYEKLADDANVTLPSLKDDHLLDSIQVKNSMIHEVISFHEGLNALEAFEKAKETDITGFPVIRNDRLIGIVSMTDFRQASEEELSQKTVGEICVRNVVTLHPDQSLLLALQKFRRYHVGRIIVVDREDPKKILGIITPMDIMKSFGVSIGKDLDLHVD